MGSVLNIADGIRVIDTGYIRKEMAAIYLVRQGNEIAIIETGTKHSIPNVQQALEKDGLFADNKTTSKFFLSFFITSNVDVPIEPVEPSIAIFFFIME